MGRRNRITQLNPAGPCHYAGLGGPLGGVPTFRLLSLSCSCGLRTLHGVFRQDTVAAKVPGLYQPCWLKTRDSKRIWSGSFGASFRR
jgi:hypothetical protein